MRSPRGRGGNVFGFSLQQGVYGAVLLIVTMSSALPDVFAELAVAGHLYAVQLVHSDQPLKECVRPRIVEHPVALREGAAVLVDALDVPLFSQRMLRLAAHKRVGAGRAVVVVHL